MKKKKRTATFGKYTQIVYGAKRFGGWTRDGLIHFNELHGQVKEDRKKWCHCRAKLQKSLLENRRYTKKVLKIYARDIVAICKDVTDLI